MSVLPIVIPLMVLAVLVATVPVLWGSVRHHRAMRDGRIETTETARQEAEFWHRMLGRRRRRGVVATPELLDDGEVARSGARSEDRRTVNGNSVWTTPR
jgi:hypothetical protein